MNFLYVLSHIFGWSLFWYFQNISSHFISLVEIMHSFQESIRISLNSFIISFIPIKKRKDIIFQLISKANEGLQVFRIRIESLLASWHYLINNVHFCRLAQGLFREVAIQMAYRHSEAWEEVIFYRVVVFLLKMVGNEAPFISQLVVESIEPLVFRWAPFHCLGKLKLNTFSQFNPCLKPR